MERSRVFWVWLVAVPLALAIVACTRGRPAQPPVSPHTTTPVLREGSEEALSANPLGLPSLNAGEPCRRTPGVPGHEYSSIFGPSFALGDGPVFPMFVGLDPEHVHYERGTTVHVTNDRVKGGWLRVRALWIAPHRMPTARTWCAAASSTDPCASGSVAAILRGTGCCSARAVRPHPAG